MPSTTVQYINPNPHSNESKNTPKDIRIIYLKATIAILALALAIVSAVLVWRLLAEENDCNEHLAKVSFSFIQILVLHSCFMYSKFDL
jgi:hypothetical protein